MILLDMEWSAGAHSVRSLVFGCCLVEQWFHSSHVSLYLGMV